MNFRTRRFGLKQKISGQISILIILSLIPLFTLFAFSVNIGMLVNAKISLQNAADVAAYAGAATQARQMTHISHLNYKIRQNYKKFLYRYYVIGNMSLRCYPRPNLPPECTAAGFGDTGKMEWRNPAQNGTGYPGIPTTCISLTNESNPCQIGKPLPTVRPPPCNSLDPSCGAMTNTALTIAKIQEKSCQSNSGINSSLLSHWLYAVDDNNAEIANSNLIGMITDPGLVVESLVDYQRIATLQKFINSRPLTEIKIPMLSRLESEADLGKVERTILAFKSAAKNLNEFVFDTDSITMTELLPAGATGSDLLNLKQVKVNVKAGYTVMEPDGQAGASGDLQGNSQSCNIRVKSVSANPVVGVYKADNNLVYYAVKLTAKAKLLFNPFPFGSPDDGLDLTAYAAAAPFGSRIGPVLQESDFYKQGELKPNDPNGDSVIRYPWLKISEDYAWDSREILKAFHQVLRTQGPNSTNSSALNSFQYNLGLRAAMLPDEVELGKYNIPSDSLTEEGTPAESPTLFEGQSKLSVQAGSFNETKYTFWAPVHEQGGRDELLARIEQDLNTLSFNTLEIGGPPDEQAIRSLKGLFTTKINVLLGKLAQKNNLNVAQIFDPLSEGVQSANNVNFGIPGKVISRRRLLTSYSTDRDYPKYTAGRDGYSVKIIPFRQLVKQPGALSNTQGGFQNWKTISGVSSTELPELSKLFH